MDWPTEHTEHTENTPPPVPPAIPDHELLRCIGRGSYGEVWLERNVLGQAGPHAQLHPARGAAALIWLFEQFVGLELIRAARLASPERQVRFWRDPDGPEVDWVVVAGDKLLPIRGFSGGAFRTCGGSLPLLHRMEERAGVRRFVRSAMFPLTPTLSPSDGAREERPGDCVPTKNFGMALFLVLLERFAPAPAVNGFISDALGHPHGRWSL